MKIITPLVNCDQSKSNCYISDLYYRGMSLLRYSIHVNLDLDVIEFLLDEKHCCKELITVKDPVFDRRF
jgi:hypothetical protein